MSHDEIRSGFPEIREVSFGAPLRWLAMGFRDIRHCPLPSAFYGCSFAVMGFALVTVFNHAYQYVAALACGFLLVAPFLAIGLYELSRRREAGASCRLGPTLAIWRKNAANIGVYSLVLTVVFLIWARASLIVFALFYTTQMPTLSDFLRQVWSPDNMDFLFAYFAVGLGFALLVFAISVVSIPMMMDRGQDAITAMLASFLSLVLNFPAMILWAFLIVVATAVGFATFYLGLIVAMPLIGHATWHAYRDLVAVRADASSGAEMPRNDA